MPSRRPLSCRHPRSSHSRVLLRCRSVCRSAFTYGESCLQIRLSSPVLIKVSTVGDTKHPSKRLCFALEICVGRAAPLSLSRIRSDLIHLSGCFQTPMGEHALRASPPWVPLTLSIEIKSASFSCVQESSDKAVVIGAAAVGGIAGVYLFHELSVRPSPCAACLTP